MGNYLILCKTTFAESYDCLHFKTVNDYVVDQNKVKITSNKMGL